MEEGEWDHDDIIIEYGALLNDTPMGGPEEEVAAEDELTDDPDNAICDAIINDPIIFLFNWPGFGKTLVISNATWIAERQCM